MEELGVWFRTHGKPKDPHADYGAMNPRQASKYSFPGVLGDAEKLGRAATQVGLDSMVSLKETLLHVPVGKRQGIPRGRSVRLDLGTQV